MAPLESPQIYSFLQTENIARSTAEIEYHPLHPFLPKNCKVLFLGSFPPQRKRWCMDFYYPNFINDHWRIEGLIFFGDKDYFVDKSNKTFRLERIIPFLEQKGIGFYDTNTAVRRLRDNASDKFLETIEATDVSAMLRLIPQCRVVVTTGEKATQILCQHFKISKMPSVGEAIPIPKMFNETRPLYLYRLPSSSRAYPMSLERKAEAYRKMFEFINIE